MNSKVTRYSAILGVLYALPNLVASFAALLYLQTEGLLAPPSLARVIGGAAVVWTWIIVLGMIATGVLALFTRRPRAMLAETVLRPMVGAFLLGYAYGLMHGGGLVTAGFVAAAGVQQFTRLVFLRVVALPQARAVRVLLKRGELL